jgi:hypothetical protein
MVWRRAKHLGLRAACRRFRSWQLAAGMKRLHVQIIAAKVFFSRSP